MGNKSLLASLLLANQLKRTARTGWVQRGVPDPENVATHTFGVGFTTLLLAPTVPEPINLGKALAMAILHDMPEALTSDIPTPAWRYFPEGSKIIAEQTAMIEIAGDTEFQNEMLILWKELKEEHSAEARLVHDADKLDLYLQALVYERQSGNHYLAEFWLKNPSFHFDQSKALYEEIRVLRSSELDL